MHKKQIRLKEQRSNINVIKNSFKPIIVNDLNNFGCELGGVRFLFREYKRLYAYNFWVCIHICSLSYYFLV